MDQRAEEMGATMARVIRAILDDLDLTPEQAARAPAICRRHLMAAAAEERTSPDS
jgi:hypothetical protein